MIASLPSLAAAADTLAACDDHRFAMPLAPAVPADAVRDARAVWLDGTRLLWPGAPSAERYRLYRASRGGIVAKPGHRVRGSEGSTVLRRSGGELGAAEARRFGYLGEGVVLTLAARDGDALATWLRGELVLVAEDRAGKVLASTQTQVALALDDRYAAAATVPGLGVSVARDSTAFAVWAPTAQTVAVCLYRDGVGKADAVWPLRRDDVTGVWRAQRPEDRRGGYYTYLVDVFVPGTGLLRNRVTDPYAISLTTDSRRAWIGSLDDPATQPTGWGRAKRPKPLAAMTDLVVYELHVRDFSMTDETVPVAHRGKYLGFAQHDSDGMKHLRRLAQAGITDVHLLPAFDFATVPEADCVEPTIAGTRAGDTQQRAIAEIAPRDCYNWGYDPLHYTAPEGSYATDPADGAVRVREFRAMVQALHAVGLRVGMDVVYNHTSASGQSDRSVLDRIVPGYYQRLDTSGAVATSTCCANTATEHRMMARLMIDSVATWAREYHVDSFRFDLMGHQPRDAMERLQQRVDAAAGRRVPLIGEGWNFGEIADDARFVQASQRSLAGSGIATFSDRARDAVRGGGPADDDARLVLRQGWVNGLFYDRNAAADPNLSRDALLDAADLVRVGLAGTLQDYVLQDRQGKDVPLSQLKYNGEPAGYVGEPGEVVNYVENHDGLTLFDVNALKLPVSTMPGDRARVQVLALAVVTFSQGVAYFHAGGEILRSKSLDRNSYDSGDWFNRIDWTGRDNHFATGLPPKPDNGKAWHWMRTRLVSPLIKPGPAEIAWTRAAFEDLLRIRASSTLFRLRSAADVRERLHFLDTGPDQLGTMLAARLDGRGYPGAKFDSIIYFLNVDDDPHTLTVDAAREQPYALHPVHRRPEAADHRVIDAATFDRRTGRFSIPPRTAAVFVVAGGRRSR